MRRRKFIKSSASAATIPFLPFPSFFESNSSAQNLEIHVFSKHLQFLDYEEMGQVVKEMGFDGADLTVRPGGHVSPENVKTDLPKAVKALKKSGLQTKLITTAINDADNSVNQTLLETAAKNGIEYYRMAYFAYPKEEEPQIQAMERLSVEAKKIADLNKKFGIHGSYQNHAGAKYVGASIWEIEKILSKCSLPELGCQFDVRHAVVEGGLSWPNSVRLLRDRINTINLKDFIWEKINGKWRVLNTPLGEGMVDFDAYFKLLKKYEINVPVSLHLEYDLGGAEHGRSENIDKDRVYAAMRRDLKKARELWEKA